MSHAGLRSIFLEIYRLFTAPKRASRARALFPTVAAVHAVAVLRIEIYRREGGRFSQHDVTVSRPDRAALSRQFPPIIFFSHDLRPWLARIVTTRYNFALRRSRKLRTPAIQPVMWYYWRGTCQHDPPFYGEQTAAASEPPSSNRWLRWVAPERDCPVFRHWRLPRTSQLAWLNQTNG